MNVAAPGNFASVLADVLSLGLPYPRYIELHPEFGFIVFQFGGSDETGVAEVIAWAAAFTAPLVIDAADPKATWFCADFTRSGIKFHAYAAPDTPSAVQRGRS